MMMSKEERDRLRHDLMASDKYSSGVWKLFDTCDELEAQIAALKEPMACGHPKACWVTMEHFSENGGPTVDKSFCDACAHEAQTVRLERAAALRLVKDKYYEEAEGSAPFELWLDAQIAANQSALEALIEKRVAEARPRARLDELEHTVLTEAYVDKRIRKLNDEIAELERATAPRVETS